MLLSLRDHHKGMDVQDILGSINAQNGLVSQAVGAPQRVTQAIRQASARAGVDFDYLLNKATQESSLNPNAKASGSSATGLFQFIEQTWLRVVKTYGEKYGLSEAADRIAMGSDGVARVKDPQTKQAILALRKDPALSAGMAAELTNENKAVLQNEVGGKIGSTELYLAHFLGAGGASAFLSTMRATPNAQAAAVLPEAAAANPSVFYDKAGQPRSLAQIYDRFARKFDGESQTATMVADAASLAPLPTMDVESLPAVAGLSGSVASLSSYSSINSFKAESAASAPFVTMLLAQMDLGALSPTSSDGDEGARKRAPLSFLGATA